MQNSPNQPMYVMPQDTQRTYGREAQRLNITAAKIVAELVRTTLGPKGMDKMLVDAAGDVTVTNDGATILNQIQIEHPTAKMIVEVAKTQESEVGDGTTTVVVLAGELLKQAESLLEKDIHPTIVARGYRLAADKALTILESFGKTITLEDTDTLHKIAHTAMTGKGAEDNKERLSALVVKAAIAVAQNTKITRALVHIEKRVGGSVDASELISGIVLDKERVHSGMPTQITAAKIALYDGALEIKTTEIDARISITDPEKLQAFLDMEEGMLKRMVQKIVASGANVVLCQKGIDDLAQHYLAKAGILAARRVKKSDMARLAQATGGTIITNLDDLSSADLGNAGSVEEKQHADEGMLYLQDCPAAKVVTILVRGGSEHVVSEVARALDDALGDIASAINHGKVVAGAGAPEMALAHVLQTFASTLSGREQLAVRAFAQSLEIIPTTLAENAGIDPIDAITALKAAHEAGERSTGINVFTGKTMNAWEHDVIEPLKIKLHAISAAAEVAIMILRIDDVIASDDGSKNPAPHNPMQGM